MYSLCDPDVEGKSLGHIAQAVEQIYTLGQNLRLWRKNFLSSKCNRLEELKDEYLSLRTLELSEQSYQTFIERSASLVP